MIIMLSKSVEHNLQVVIIVSEPNIISRNRTFDHFLLYLEHFLNQRLLECQNNPASGHPEVPRYLVRIPLAP